MENVLIFIFCLFILSYSGFAQTETGIRGSIMDAQTEEAIPYVYVYLKGQSHYSALSDTDGTFRIAFPDAIQTDTLIFSRLGYGNLAVPLKGLTSQGLRIKMKGETIGLSEVTIKPGDSFLEQLFVKVIENLPRTTPNKKHGLEGFYRKVSTQKDDYVHLMEAAISLEESSYKLDNTHTKIQINELRSTVDYGLIDSTVIQSIQRLGENRGAVINPLFQSLDKNHVRQYHFSAFLFDMGGVFFTSFFGNRPVYQQISNVEYIGRDTVYTIAFSSIDPPSGETYIKINTADYGVMELQTTFFWGNPEKGIKELDYQVYVKTQQIEGRYYPEKFKVVLRRHINRLSNENQLDIHTFYFDTMQTKGFKRIKPAKRLAANKLIDVTNYTYHPDFWENNPFLNKYPLDPDIKKSLESKGDLESQFSQASLPY